jgi:hypothetical protein
MDEPWLLPPSVREFVPEGHAAHLVRDIVAEELDLSAILSAYTELRGYPPHHPAMMVALLRHAYGRIACADGSNPRASSSGSRPARTSLTICRRNSGG